MQSFSEFYPNADSTLEPAQEVDSTDTRDSDAPGCYGNPDDWTGHIKSR